MLNLCSRKLTSSRGLGLDLRRPEISDQIPDQQRIKIKNTHQSMDALLRISFGLLMPIIGDSHLPSHFNRFLQFFL